MSSRLSGHNALVTGGSRGIGRAIALRLAADGAGVAINYKSNRSAADEVAAQIENAGGKAIAIGGDVGDQAAARSMVEQAANALGTLDILVNNAGLLHAGTLLEHDQDEFEVMWRTNVQGVLNCSAAAAPAMIEAGWGRIINIASNAAVGTSMPGTTLYAATKGAVLSLTKRFALELGGHGITANAVLPGFTVTDMVSHGKSADEMGQLMDKISGMSMLGRTGVPEDISNVVAFLASDESSFMTGQFLLADGGRKDYLAQT